jgi:TusA-related sulfurtransferase
MPEELQINKTVDLKGQVCPFPWVKSKKALAKMEIGQVLKVIVDHAPAVKNIPRYFGEEGQSILSVDKINELDWQIIVKKEK